jgi:hypothetical protein
MASFRLKSVNQQALTDLISQQPQRGRTSKGGELVQQFVESGETAATVDLGSTKERNAVSISAANHARNNDVQVWVRKLGGGTGTELLLINLTKADAATRQAYESRPRPGRRPAKR